MHGASGDSDDHGTGSGSGGTVFPHIPVQINSFAGVSVERAAEGTSSPGVMYVQVKCRDRRGLLLDIINALKCLPVEIRTATVTTTGDGMVRDVFEIKSEDETLLPEVIQNMVHDALYHQSTARGDDGTFKRLKSSTD